MTHRNLRNIGVIAHVDAGKTTLTERILYFAGKSHRMGDVHHGTTVTDSSIQEREKGITISSAAVSVEWKGHLINIIDTPGHIDFNVEVNRSLRVLDGAVVVFDAVAGVEPQSETNWRLADSYEVPRICLVNKMDRIGADFLKVEQSIREQLGAKTIVLQLPIGVEDGFRGVIDLISMEALCWSEDGSQIETTDIPGSLQALAEHHREQLMNLLADHDDAVLSALLAEQMIEVEHLHRVVRRLVIDHSFVPVLCASAFKNKGVQPLLDAVTRYLPAPEEKSAVVDLSQDDEVKMARSRDEPFAALAFKVTSGKHGMLTYLRVYCGQLKVGEKVLNTSSGKQERISRMYRMHADRKEPMDSVEAGDIVAVSGLKHSDSGDTLCDPERAVVLERISVPKPVIAVSVEAKSKMDQSKLSEALHSLVSEDPSLQVNVDADGQTILSGMGELHIEVAISRLKTDFDVEALVGKPRVSYRETLGQPVEIDHRHKKQRGGPGQFAEVQLIFEPIDGDQIEFENRIVGGDIPLEYIPSVESGIRKAAMSGVLGGYTCGGFKASLIGGGFHAQDSSQMAFEVAGIEAFKEAAKSAKPKLLEPIAALEVVTPQDHVGDCVGDINRRRGIVTGQQFRSNATVINANVPLSEMFGYVGDLRSLTSGRATFSMAFDHYDEVPESLVARVIDV